MKRFVWRLMVVLVIMGVINFFLPLEVNFALTNWQDARGTSEEFSPTLSVVYDDDFFEALAVTVILFLSFFVLLRIRSEFFDEDEEKPLDLGAITVFVVWLIFTILGLAFNLIFYSHEYSVIGIFTLIGARVGFSIIGALGCYVLYLVTAFIGILMVGWIFEVIIKCFIYLAKKLQNLRPSTKPIP